MNMLYNDLNQTILVVLQPVRGRARIFLELMLKQIMIDMMLKSNFWSRDSVSMLELFCETTSFVVCVYQPECICFQSWLFLVLLSLELKMPLIG